MGWYSVSYVTINIFLNALASRHSVGEVCTVQSEETDCVGRIARTDCAGRIGAGRTGRAHCRWNPFPFKWDWCRRGKRRNGETDLDVKRRKGETDLDAKRRNGETESGTEAALMLH